jgi:hypothetical protein
METEGPVPDVIDDQHQLNPDMRLARNAKAVEIRVDRAKRMWELVQAETSRRTSPLDMDVANALQRMWKVKEGGALRTQ